MQGLFKKGMTEAADKQLQAGLEEGWSLNAAVYEQLILGLCQIGNTTEATRMLNRMDVRLSQNLQRLTYNTVFAPTYHCSPAAARPHCCADFIKDCAEYWLFAGR